MGVSSLHRSGGRPGQATVELAVTLPVAVVTMMIIVNAMWFLSVASAFDHIVPQVILDVVQGSGPGDSSTIADRVEAGVVSRLGAPARFSVEVQAVDGTGDRSALEILAPTAEIRATLRFTPWPAPGRNVSVGGFSSGTFLDLRRERSLTVGATPWGIS